MWATRQGSTGCRLFLREPDGHPRALLFPRRPTGWRSSARLRELPLASTRGPCLSRVRPYRPCWQFPAASVDPLMRNRDPLLPRDPPESVCVCVAVVELMDSRSMRCNPPLGRRSVTRQVPRNPSPSRSSFGSARSDSESAPGLRPGRHGVEEEPSSTWECGAPVRGRPADPSSSVLCWYQAGARSGEPPPPWPARCPRGRSLRSRRARSWQVPPRDGQSGSLSPDANAGSTSPARSR